MSVSRSVGQSAMSSTLARLRKLLDDPLLVRDGRELVATPYAESRVKPVREVLDGVEAILASASSTRPGRSAASPWSPATTR